ncbi:DUF3558 family protein [Nocardia sp. NPDC088792]|uniref:DUF3558 family protein n=1 Tax=Nocardia sp. NPDC088792 TaxID=3364332 RepID=UPI0038098875
MITAPAARAATAVSAAVVVALLAGGCEGKTNSTPAAPAWNPCTAFPESALQNAGLDPKTQDRIPGMCSWSGSTHYRVDIRYLTKASGANWQLGHTDITSIKISPYAGHTFHDARENSNYLCGLQLETRGADVTFEVTNSLLQDEDPCAVATRIATGLKDYLPAAP